ncbi:MAG: hypothetical protein QM778_04015 [Myxococcales bacterium]
MRTFLSIALSLAVAVPVAVAQPATPPAPPGGVGGPPASVPGVPAPAPLAPVAPAELPPPAQAVPAAVPAAPVPLAVPVPAASVAPVAPAAAPEAPASAAPNGQPAPTTLPPLPAWTPEARATATRRPVRRAPPTPPPYVRRSAGAPFALAVGGGLVWNDDVGYRLVGAKREPQFDAFASYDILQPGKRLVVSLGASIRHARANSEGLEITDNTLQAELIARFAMRSWLWPHGRASVGGAWTRVKLDDQGRGGSIDERDLGLASSFGGGITLRTPTRALETAGGRAASLSLGILVEGGYTLASAANFSGVPSGATDLERGAVRLGTLTRSAPYMRIMAVVRF